MIIWYYWVSAINIVSAPSQDAGMLLGNNTRRPSPVSQGNLTRVYRRAELTKWALYSIQCVPIISLQPLNWRELIIYLSIYLSIYTYLSIHMYMYLLWLQIKKWRMWEKCKICVLLPILTSRIPNIILIITAYIWRILNVCLLKERALCFLKDTLVTDIRIFSSAFCTFFSQKHSKTNCCDCKS
jgi:hypothetical protein